VDAKEAAEKVAASLAGLETRIVRRKLSELKLLPSEQNARYMTPQEFEQLVDNLRADGRLTSVPLVYRDQVLSGNHRTGAAVKAGIEDADVMEILTEIDEERQLAIQLAHNAINGKDDPNVLAKLYAKVQTLGLRKYTGVTDDMLQVSEEKMASLGITRPRYEELTIVFLPEEKDVFLELLQRLDDKARQRIKGDVVVARDENFDRLFAAIVRVKREKKVINNAVAIRVLAELALRALDQELQSTPAAAT
jgi:hypothetical protein